MKDYLNDLLVWAIILAVLVPIFIGLLKRKRAYITLIGLIVLVSAIPAAFMSELSIGGCCGAPSTGREGLGHAIGILVAMIGISIIVFSKKLAKQ